MITYIAYYQILGNPLILYIGVITYFCFVFTALIPILNKKGVWNVSMLWHFRLAKLSLAFATLHGLLGILSNIF